jgi:large subunit ribosomal protein L30
MMAERRTTRAPSTASTVEPGSERRAGRRTAAAKPAATPNIRIKLVRSPIGNRQRHKDTVRSLGLRRLNQIVEQPDNPQIRGMIFAVKHLVEVIE